MTKSTTPGNAGSVITSLEEKMEADASSIYVGNVDYGATAEELEAHFHGCGSVNRVTTVCDKLNSLAKVFGYIEFLDKSVRTFLTLDDSQFRGRQIKVIPISTTDGLPVCALPCPNYQLQQLPVWILQRFKQLALGSRKEFLKKERETEGGKLFFTKYILWKRENPIAN